MDQYNRKLSIPLWSKTLQLSLKQQQVIWFVSSITPVILFSDVKPLLQLQNRLMRVAIT